MQFKNFHSFAWALASAQNSHPNFINLNHPFLSFKILQYLKDRFMGIRLVWKRDQFDLVKEQV
jgi:hypothetical protein